MAEELQRLLIAILVLGGILLAVKYKKSATSEVGRQVLFGHIPCILFYWEGVLMFKLNERFAVPAKVKNGKILGDGIAVEVDALTSVIPSAVVGDVDKCKALRLFLQSIAAIPKH